MSVYVVVSTASGGGGAAGPGGTALIPGFHVLRVVFDASPSDVVTVDSVVGGLPACRTCPANFESTVTARYNQPDAANSLSRRTLVGDHVAFRVSNPSLLTARVELVLSYRPASSTSASPFPSFVPVPLPTLAAVSAPPRPSPGAATTLDGVVIAGAQVLARTSTYFTSNSASVRLFSFTPPSAGRYQVAAFVVQAGGDPGGVWLMVGPNAPPCADCAFDYTAASQRVDRRCRGCGVCG